MAENTENKRMAKQPMLYIAQPNFKPAEVSMQTSFRTQRSNPAPAPAEQPAKSEAQSTSLHEKELRLRNQNKTPNAASPSKAKEDAPAEEAENKEQSESSRDRRLRFHELSLEEKVNYFFTLSPHVPKMKCEVTANDDNKYRGYITDYKEGIVHMKIFQRPFQQEVPFKDITDIRLIGF
ncbi:CotO family spore coat protein [Halobacillus sp. K22]|uniref:CotO family spore coat protein n=1 Tax=Halobacillus sp. K22 TaxID=3457431 RepID=UPI003FCDFAFD